MRPIEDLNQTDQGCTRMEYETFFVVSPFAEAAATLRDKKFPDEQYAQQVVAEVCSGLVYSIPLFTALRRPFLKKEAIVRIYVKQ